MYYKKALDSKLENNLFKAPTQEYRACPFWAWNSTLNPEYLEEQIRAFREMGFGGFFMHPRIGLRTEYLSEEFFEAVKASISSAEKQGLQAWLYDEDRYPSGYAGGKVTEECRYRYQYLVFSTTLPEETGDLEEFISKGVPYLLACYNVQLGEDGMLLNYKRVEKETADCGERWYAYLTMQKQNWWYNGQTYIDVLSPEPMERFLEVTHEAYKERFADKFGSVVPGVFTDEPQPLPDAIQTAPLSGDSVSFSWTIGLEQQFEEENGFSLVDTLPELVWELPEGRVSKTRYFYRKLISDRFYEGFFLPYASWCSRNGLIFTGHLQDENSLIGQTGIMGEAMRCYKAFELPGIDILCDNIELCTAKQAQSVVHQYGKEGISSELYGTTNWDFDFRRHKFQGDWQAALGVTVRVPHLAWLSMEGCAKRDYPASINLQSPWYKEYSYLEEHYARINTALTRGKAMVKIGVIHPIESLWMCYGNKHDTAFKVEAMQERFEHLTEWLIYGKQDFNFISEALLPELFGGAEDGKIRVGQMQYEAIIVPWCMTLRKSTVDILNRYVEAGGKLIFTGEVPGYVDAVPSDTVKDLIPSAVVIPHDEYSIMQQLEDLRMVEIRHENGTLDRTHIYQLREDSNDKWLFIAQGKKTSCVDVIHPESVIIRIRGNYVPMCYDTLNGKIEALPYKTCGEYTEIPYCFYQHDSLLLKLTEISGQEELSDSKKEPSKFVEVIDFKTPVYLQREEDNVYLLDMAEWMLDDDVWQPMEEILRIDKKCREILGYPIKGAIQPWVAPKDENRHSIRLRFQIESEIELEDVALAFEKAEEIVWNGQLVIQNNNDYYVDRAIKRLNMHGLAQGNNTLEIKVPITNCDGPESLYLLGDFDVVVSGCHKKIAAARRTISFGNLVNQGMPFYGGNLSYIMNFETQKCSVKIHAWHYRGAVVKVILDGDFKGYIAFEPYELLIENLEQGEHCLELILCGTRVNTFGCLHNADTSIVRFGPPAWQSQQSAWSYEYRLWETGILSSPIIEILDK